MSDKSIFDAITRRDLKAVSEMIHGSTSMIDLDPEKVLRSPWLWDAKTIEWATRALDLRARLSLESRDEQERVGANTWMDRDADEYAVPRTGPID